MKRGDVLIVRVGHPSGDRGKKRPVVVIQSDQYASIHTVLVAVITSNLTLSGDPANLLIDITTPDGKATRLPMTSVASAYQISFVYRNDKHTKLGAFSPAMMAAFDQCLRYVLNL